MADKDQRSEEEQRNERNDKFAPYKISPAILQGLAEGERRKVILEVNLDYKDGVPKAQERLEKLLLEVTGPPVVNAPGVVAGRRPAASRYYVFAELTHEQLIRLVKLDTERANRRKNWELIFKIWPDRELQTFSSRSIRTIKADACTRSFGGEGKGIVWAVIDSGVDGSHAHFATHMTLGSGSRNAAPDDQWVWSQHASFIDAPDPLVDEFGHGTHVAGVIAGATPLSDRRPRGRKAQGETPAKAVTLVRRREDETVRIKPEELSEPIGGVARLCKIVSLKVLDAAGAGHESRLLAALDHVATINGDGRRIRIHGVNISIGYEFDAQWFAAGQSPVCVAVNRLVRTGVVVVVAAGNSGSTLLQPDGAQGSLKRVGLDQSIADPGNADLAITVGSTHPEAPHTYGISYFSSRGPTTDGRNKPDLVAPGERIVSCASAQAVQRVIGDAQFDDEDFKFDPATVYYRDDTGTSMAAPHVSGAAAAFLSIHGEFIGQPERVKEVLMGSATDLKRKREFQGAGLLDLLRAVQSV